MSSNKPRQAPMYNAGMYHDPEPGDTRALESCRVVNLDHHNTLPGGVGMPHDRAVVLSTTETEPHPLTGKPQPKQLFPTHGVCTLEEANKWARSLLSLSPAATSEVG